MGFEQVCETVQHPLFLLRRLAAPAPILERPAGGGHREIDIGVITRSDPVEQLAIARRDVVQAVAGAAGNGRPSITARGR